jgi:hypothetical protein
MAMAHHPSVADARCPRQYRVRQALQQQPCYSAGRGHQRAQPTDLYMGLPMSVNHQRCQRELGEFRGKKPAGRYSLQRGKLELRSCSVPKPQNRTIA